MPKHPIQGQQLPFGVDPGLLGGDVPPPSEDSRFLAVLLQSSHL